VDLVLYRDETGFAALRDEWDDLLRRSRFDTIFLTWEWQTTWWRYVGTSRGPLYLLAARQNGRILGILPLYMTEQAGKRSLQVIGCIEVADYLDLIVEAGQEDAVYEAFMAWLAGPEAPQWDVLDLCNQPAASLAYTRLPVLATAAGWAAEVFQEDVCPIVSLPGEGAPGDHEDGWERYLAGLDKKERHEIRRKLRRVERELPDHRFQVVSGPEGLDAAVDSFIELHRLSSRAKDAFMTDEMVAFFRALAAALADQGRLKLFFLEAEGRPVASYFCFDYLNEILVYNSGYDPEAYPQFSFGWVLMARILQYAIAEGRSRVDFLQGNEDYKHRFGGVDTPVHRTLIWKA
jgi:CelD/BcsL family acetyltransferase involved in cellulose biosynthesis